MRILEGCPQGFTEGALDVLLFLDFRIQGCPRGGAELEKVVGLGVPRASSGTTLFWDRHQHPSTNRRAGYTLISSSIFKAGTFLPAAFGRQVMDGKGLLAAADYPLYLQLMRERKTLQVSPILLEPKRNNRHFIMKETPVTHVSIPEEDISVIVEASLLNQRHFGFKIRAGFLSPVPCFRFDGDGQTHRNDGDSIPLPQRQITTPHFHKCREDGTLVAYKTAALLDQAEEQTLTGDINLALAHFCHEANVRFREDGFPETHPREKELPLATGEFDPLNGVSFDE
jgi:hypothetical protein